MIHAARQMMPDRTWCGLDVAAVEATGFRAAIGQLSRPDDACPNCWDAIDHIRRSYADAMAEAWDNAMKRAQII